MRARAQRRRRQRKRERTALINQAPIRPSSHLVISGRDDILVWHPCHVHSRLQQLLKLAQPLRVVRKVQSVGKPAGVG